MRRPVSGILVLFLLFALLFVQKASVPLVNGSSSIYQGDLILTGNNVTTIEGRFDINGSIIVQDNATLMLKNAFLNLTQSEPSQYYIWFRNPSNGNPRLLAYNSTITSSYANSGISFLDNSTATVNNSTIEHSCTYVYDSSVISISNNSYIAPGTYGPSLNARESSVITVHNSTVDGLLNWDSSKAQVYDSEINKFFINPESVNCTVSKLEPDSFSYWSFITNCSVTIQSGGSTPNITLTDTKVNEWTFYFYGNSNATISNSTIETVSAWDTSIIYLKSSTTDGAGNHDSSMLFIENSPLTYVSASGSSKTWFLNSTCGSLSLYNSAEVYFSWYLNVHIKNSIDQNVPSASVTVTFPNATVAGSKLTDANGLARFPLMEKMMNATGQYPIGNYTVKAEYGTYSSSTKANMTGNQEVTIQLPFGAPSPTPSPSPSPSPSSSPTPSPAPTPTPSSSPSPTTAPTPTPEPKPSLFLPIEALFGIGAIITIAVILIVFISLRKRKLD